MAKIPLESLTGAPRAHMSPKTPFTPPRDRIIVKSAAAAQQFRRTPCITPAIPSTHRAHARRHTRSNTSRNVERNNECNTPAIHPHILRCSTVIHAPHERHTRAACALVLALDTAHDSRSHSGLLASLVRIAIAMLALCVRTIERLTSACVARVMRRYAARRVALQRECDAILAPMYPLTLHSYRAAPARELRPHSAATAALSPAGSPS